LKFREINKKEIIESKISHSWTGVAIGVVGYAIRMKMRDMKEKRENRKYTNENY